MLAHNLGRAQYFIACWAASGKESQKRPGSRRVRPALNHAFKCLRHLVAVEGADFGRQLEKDREIIRPV